MAVKTKGGDPVLSFDIAKGNVAAAGPPAQQQGPVLGPGDAGFVSPSDYEAIAAPYQAVGHPVDLYSGAVVDNAVDLSMMGPLMVHLKRSYNSFFTPSEGPLGMHGWRLNLYQFVEEGAGGTLRLRNEDGRYLTFPDPEAGGEAVLRSRSLSIERTGPGSFVVRDLGSGQVRRFESGNDRALHQRAFLTELRDRSGNAVFLKYQGRRLVEATSSFGRSLRFLYDEQGALGRAELALGDKVLRHVDYSYHPTGELAQAVDASGNAVRYEYDGLHRMTLVRLANGLKFRYAYDENSQCVRTWGDGGLHENEIVREANDEGVQVTTTGTLQPGIYQFDREGRLLREQTFDRRFTRTRSYDADGCLSTETDAAGNSDQFEHDSRGHLIRHIDAAGNEERWAFDGDTIRSFQSKSGLVSTYSHDGSGRVTAIHSPTGDALTLEYDRRGQVARVTGGLGLIAECSYTEAGDLASVTNSVGATWRFESDDSGYPVRRIHPKRGATTVEYDVLGRPTRVFYSDGTSIERDYDALGNVSQLRTRDGATVLMEYIAPGALSRLTTADGSEWSFKYDTSERLVEIKNPRAEVHQFEYDTSGRVVAERTVDGRRATYEYDLAGRLSRVLQADGTTRSFERDVLGNLVRDTSSHMVIEFERDALGRLLKATLDEGRKVEISLERDEFGRVVAEHQAAGSLTFAYDRRGQLVERSVKDCGSTAYRYDGLGALVGLSHQSPGAGELSLQVLRDGEGLGIGFVVNGKSLLSQEYDTAGNLAMQRIGADPNQGKDSDVVTRAWKYDAVGRPVALEDSRWGPETFRYDLEGRLMAASSRDKRQSFEYLTDGSVCRAPTELENTATVRDAEYWDVSTGNLLRRTPSEEFTYDDAHRCIARSERQTGDTTRYLWDCLGCLREIQQPDGTRVRYYYDAFGRRVRKEVYPPLRVVASSEDALGESEAMATDFLWQGNQLVAELPSAGRRTTHVHQPGSFLPLLQATGDQISIAVTDHRGTVRELLRPDGTVAWSGHYDPWGSLDAEHPAKGAPAERDGHPQARPSFGWLGHYRDEETDLSCARFRYWDPRCARWMSPDPLDLFGGLNLFALDGAPTQVVDPWGLQTNAQIGALGESSAASFLSQQGYSVHGGSQNTSGHGIDLVVTNAAGEVQVIEVKANTSRMSDAQNKGADFFGDSRSTRAQNWSRPESAATVPNADLVADQRQRTGRVNGLVIRVDVDANGKATITHVLPWC